MKLLLIGLFKRAIWVSSVMSGLLGANAQSTLQSQKKILLTKPWWGLKAARYMPLSAMVSSRLVWMIFWKFSVNSIRINLASVSIQNQSNKEWKKWSQFLMSCPCLLEMPTIHSWIMAQTGTCLSRKYIYILLLRPQFLACDEKLP